MKHLDKQWLEDRNIEYIPINGPLFLRYNSETAPVEKVVTYQADTEEEAERFLKSATALHVYDSPSVYKVIDRYLARDNEFFEKPGYYVRCWCFELAGKSRQERSTNGL